MENKALEKLNKGQIQFGMEQFNPIKVSIGQFYGIEINDFAVTVAKTALWIAESQMMKETEEILHLNLNFLPLKSYTNIIEDNALRIDWNEVVPKEELDYIMGNPPFIGASNMNKEQKEQLYDVFDSMKRCGELDYVFCWYKKACDYMEKTRIESAFVATNSICQGEQVNIFWKPLFEKNIKINFAYKSFIWDNEASQKAQVHCVIVGFSYVQKNKKQLYSNNRLKIVKNINAFLIDAQDIFIDSFTRPLSNVTKMIRGSSPCDNGNYSFTEDEMKEFVQRNPNLKKFIKKYIGSREFINQIPRYCIWLYNEDVSEFRYSTDLRKRIENVVNFRKSSKKEKTRELAYSPLIWEANRYNGKEFILIPRVSSEKRKYIPIGFINGNTIANDSVQLIPNATLYDFGILTSNIHNAWTRIVAGRLKSDFRYSNLVYNSFIWPTPTKQQKEKIEKTAQGILDARNLYPNSSLADLYDELTMPPKLRKAHQENDKAVMEAYSFNWRTMTESDCVAELMKMYEKITTSAKEEN